MFLATFARFVARAAGLHMRFVSARVAYADSFGWPLTHRMACCVALFCTLGMGTNLSRTTNSNFGTLSYLFGANQIHSWRKPSRVRFDNDSIQISLNSILYAAALLGPPLPGPYLRTYFELPSPRGCFGSFRFAFLFLQTKFLASDF